MPDSQPQQPANEDQPASGSQPAGEPDWLEDEDGLSGLVLVPGSEPVPADRVLLPEPVSPGGGVGGGLCWSYGVDLDAILAAAAKGTPGTGGQGTLAGLGGPAGSDPGGAAPDPAAGPGGVLLPDEGGMAVDVVAEYLPGSAGLASWLDQRD
ncbi:MAG TPA: hypothetical protein VGG35_18565, partial [Streptosporangiaceae bacterium]